MTTTNFPNGLTNNTQQNALGLMTQLDPTIYHTYFNDFDEYHAVNWTVTETQAGATQALTDADGGVLLITNTAADNDLVALQKVGESFTFTAGKATFFKARLKVSDVTQSDFVIGLQITDTTPLAVSDGVYFLKADDAATVDFKVVASSTATTASAIATLADNTYYTFAFYYDGVSFVNYYLGTDTLNPTYLGRSVVTNLPTTELTVSFALQNGAAAAKTMSVDYIFVAKER
jgi:hypothetical protein